MPFFLVVCIELKASYTLDTPQPQSYLLQLFSPLEMVSHAVHAAFELAVKLRMISFFPSLLDAGQSRLLTYVVYTVLRVKAELGVC